MAIVKDRTGEKDYNNEGCKMWILEYNSSHDIVVQFESGYTVKTKYINFLEGRIKDPYTKSVYNHGYMGNGKYKSTYNGVKDKAYIIWTSMLERCYSEKSHERCDDYIDCNVCEEWLNFQNFAKWYYDNYYEVKNKKIHLDKDIKYKNNKIYSPWTCLLVPSDINLMFRKNTNPSRSKIRNLAKSYKGTIPNELYEILYNK